MLEGLDNFFNSWYTFFFVIGFAILYYIRSLFKGAQCLSMASLKGKTAIVTGSAGGLGLETCLDLARRGARVIMACREITECQDILKEMQTKSGNMNVVLMKLDLQSFSSIREFVQLFSKKEKKLHILVNNAGVMCCPRSETEDGFERQLQVNYLGPFLLTHLLLDQLKNSAPSRIVNVAAVAYKLGKINLEDMFSKNGEYSDGDSYSQSKLALMLLTRELSKQLQGSQVTVNSVHPGIAYTDIYRHMGFRSNGFLRLSFAPLCFALMKTASDGAQSTIHCAVADELEGITGKHFVECREENVDENVVTEEMSSTLYKDTKKWLRLE